MKTNQKGRSMIEMLGVLAIVGVLSVGGIAGYSKAMGKYKTNQLILEITQTIIGIRTLYTSQSSYEGISAGRLLNAGAIPAAMRGAASTSSVNHIFGGRVMVFDSPTATREQGAFEIYFTGIPENTCKELAAINWSQETTSGFMSMFIGSGDITDKQMEDVLTIADSNPSQGIYTAGTHNQGIPLSVSEVATACDCPDTACTIGFKYN